jgi:hypothetical protein
LLESRINFASDPIVIGVSGKVNKFSAVAGFNMSNDRIQEKNISIQQR